MLRRARVPKQFPLAVEQDAAVFGEGPKAEPGLVLRTRGPSERADAYYLSAGRLVFGRKPFLGIPFFERILGRVSRARG